MPNLTSICANLTIKDATITRFDNRQSYFMIHTGFIVLGAISVLLRSSLYYASFLNIARSMHKNMLISILHAKARFFDLNPTGRIINRFSRDIANLDDTLPHDLFNFLQVTKHTKLAIFIDILLNLISFY